MRPIQLDIKHNFSVEQKQTNKGHAKIVCGCGGNETEWKNYTTAKTGKKRIYLLFVPTKTKEEKKTFLTEVNVRFFVGAYKFIVPSRALFNISTSYNLHLSQKILRHDAARLLCFGPRRAGHPPFSACLSAKIDIAASSLILICIVNIINMSSGKTCG